MFKTPVLRRLFDVTSLLAKMYNEKWSMKNIEILFPVRCSNPWVQDLHNEIVIILCDNEGN